MKIIWQETKKVEIMCELEQRQIGWLRGALPAKM